MRGAGPFLAIARLAALEAIRRPVFLLVTLFCVAGIDLLPLMLNYTLGDAPRIIRDSALAFYFTGGLILASLAAIGAFTRELRTGTIAVALAKPVSRSTFFLAKTAGIALALAIFSLTSLAATLLAIRAASGALRLDWTAAGPALTALPLALAVAGAWNRRTGRSFTSAAFFALAVAHLLAVGLAAVRSAPDTSLSFPANLDLAMLPVGGLLYLSLLMATALAAALATRLPPTAVLLISVAIFAGGLLADTLLGPHLDTSLLARTVYALLPNVQVFWLMDALDTSTPIPSAYHLSAATYALLWSAALLTLGVHSFRRLEIT